MQYAIFTNMKHAHNYTTYIYVTGQIYFQGNIFMAITIFQIQYNFVQILIIFFVHGSYINLKKCSREWTLPLSSIVCLWVLECWSQMSAQQKKFVLYSFNNSYRNSQTVNKTILQYGHISKVWVLYRFGLPKRFEVAGEWWKVAGMGPFLPLFFLTL